jgi:hypothetical protein
MKCSICLGEIEVGPGGWRDGHNAEPVTPGRCCGYCNGAIVVPARLAAAFGIPVVPVVTVVDSEPAKE